MALYPCNVNNPENFTPKPLIPTMTSNTTPSGTCSEHSDFSSPAYLAFDSSDSTYAGWFQDEGISGGFVQYNFSEKHTISYIHFIASTYSANYPMNVKIQVLKNDSWIDYTDSISISGKVSYYRSRSPILSDGTWDFISMNNISAVRFYIIDTKTQMHNIYLYTLQAYGK